MPKFGQLTATIQEFNVFAELNTTGFAKEKSLRLQQNSWDNDELAYLQQQLKHKISTFTIGTGISSVTLSFWVKSSVTDGLTGDIQTQITALDNAKAPKHHNFRHNNRNKYTLTFPGDTDSGATI